MSLDMGLHQAAVAVIGAISAGLAGADGAGAVFWAAVAVLG